jgi:hypothetical protein
MGMQRWPFWILGVLVTLSSVRTSEAQIGPIMGPSPIANNASAEMAYQPWPAMTPFESRFRQYYNDGGLWQQITSNRQREYFATFEYLDSKIREAKGIVGHPQGPRYKDVFLPFLVNPPGQMGGGGGGQNAQQSMLLAEMFIGDTNIADGLGVFPPRGIPGLNLFDTRNGEDTADIQAKGFRFRIGFREADDSGIEVDFWRNSPDTGLFDAAKALTFRGNQGNPSSAGIGANRISERGLLDKFLESSLGFLTNLGETDTLMLLSRTLLNLSAIPVDDGVTRPLSDGRITILSDGTAFGGTAIPYDLVFKLRNTSESMGTALSFIRSPSIRKGPLKVSFLFGARYVYINEGFRFDGEDSGLAYDNLDDDDLVFSRAKLHSLPNFADDDINFIVDEAIFIEDNLQNQQGGGGGGGGTMMARAIRLDLVAQAAGTEHPGRYRAFLEHKMTTHLTGPEVGLDYSLGGKEFRIVGHTKVGVMANFERISLKGNNIGDANNIGNAIDLADLNDIMANPPDLPTSPLLRVLDSPIITPTAENPNPNAFRDGNRSAHVSPLVEQSIRVEMPIFSHVPFLKRVDWLSEASFTAGWTIIWVGEVIRPSQSILWRANPRAGLFPSIEPERSSWWTTNWSFGVNIPF